MGRRTARLVTAGTSLLLLVAIGLAVFWFVLGGTVRRDRSREQARAEALATARQVSVTSNSYDYTKLDSQFATISGLFTGNALADFVKNKDTLKTAFTAAKETTSAKILDAGLVSSSPDEAVAVVSLELGFSAGGKSNASLQLAKLHLVKTKGHWLVDQFDAVQ